MFFDCDHAICLSEVQRKTGAELDYNGIVGPNLGRTSPFCFVPKFRLTMPLETSTAPVFMNFGKANFSENE